MEGRRAQNVVFGTGVVAGRAAFRGCLGDLMILMGLVALVVLVEFDVDVGG